MKAYGQAAMARAAMVEIARRGRAPAAAVAFLAALVTSAFAGDIPTVAPYTYRAEVVKVIDGNTFDVDIDLGFYIWAHSQRIRLFGVEAPAPAGDTKAAGDAATAYLNGLIGGKTIILKSIRGEDSPDRKGSYGNWFGIVYLDGKIINDEMVKSGYAVASGAQ